MQLHILGTGSVSVGVKILTVAGTANLQLASLYADSALSLGRVAKDETDLTLLCVKDLPPEKTTFGASFQANLAAEILRGSFHVEVKLFGVKLKVPELAWKGLRWELGSFCFEPSALTQSKLRRMNPPTCPVRPNRGFQPMPKVVEASVRPTHDESKRSCSSSSSSSTTFSIHF